jgi:dihydroorotase
VEIISSDHAPHCDYEKEVEFDQAPFGVIGFETELALSLMALYHSKRMSLSDLIAKFTVAPARLLRLTGKGGLGPGADGDLTIMDVDREWEYDVQASASKSRNSPFAGWQLKGKATATIANGAVAWAERN